MWRVVMVSVLVASSSAAFADARSVAMLPVRARWATAADVRLAGDSIVELAGELGVEVVALDDDVTGCWRSRGCYLAAARATGRPYVLGAELVKTSSGRLYVALFLVDTERGTVRELGIVRGEPGALRGRLRPLVIALREALPARPSAHLPFPPPPGELPPLPPPPVLAEPTPVPVPWYESLSVDGFASAAFTHDFRSTGPAIPLRTYDTHSDSATIDVAEVVVQRAVTGGGDAGFRVDLTAGSAIPRVSAAAGLFRDAMGNAGDFDLQQAFVSYVAPIGRGLRIDAGKYVTPAGYEVIEGYDGYGDHYSHSFLFGYAIPFTHTGVRAGYALDDRLSVAAFGYNGWDVVADNNDSLSAGGQLTVLPVADLTVSITYLGGRERPGGGAPWRHLADLVAAYRIGERVAFGLSVDSARDGSDHWYGVAGYARADIVRVLSAAVRTEWFADPEGARTGQAQRLTEVTVTPALRLARGFLLRLEVRYDRSTAPVFGGTRSQVTTAVNAVYAL